MPHAGLMDEERLGPREGPFQRARLHIRGGRRRLKQGKIAAGIVTLYDAVLAAMDWYAASSEGRRKLSFKDGEDYRNETVLYAVLVRSGVLDGKFDFEAFDRLTERALDEEMPGYDYRDLLAGVESVMTQLGIMPFDESMLPPEDPKTF
jgi:hypothetical protein